MTHASAPLPSPVAAPVLGQLSQQLHRFFHALDERRYDILIELFTEDCRWLRQGVWLEGKAAVRAALQARPAGVETRHVLSNSFIAELDGEGERAVVESYMTAYRYPAVPPGAALPVVPGPLRFNLTTSIFRRDAEHDWRIAEQRLLPAFGF